MGFTLITAKGWLCCPNSVLNTFFIQWLFNNASRVFTPPCPPGAHQTPLTRGLTSYTISKLKQVATDTPLTMVSIQVQGELMGFKTSRV